MDAPRFLEDEEKQALAVKIIELLEGVSMGQALHILEDQAPRLLKATHVVDLGNPRFKHFETCVREARDFRL